MDAPRAREQLRRRYLFPPDTEAPLDSEGYAGPGWMIFGGKRRTKYEASTAVEKKEKPLPRLNIHSGFWILASIVVTYYVDFFKTIKENFHTNSWFVVGGALLLLSLSIACYCILYLEWCRGIEDYDVKYPTLIPITTATFIAAGICFNVALWHVWSFLTPLVLFTQFMGVVMLISLLG
ncbi:transmembrane protein 128 isoform X1 [Mirounga angustirostris]|uniref:transmembrane protein 128 isoform X1 n=1 Tax=Mirounga angustirostris TaxID=9716 RepID=UPI001E6885EE|nr:transmembrane protein 128 isoform X1 [Mirounga angustirostris]XP_045737447.1 transmembrane protein 128 isoform X1 [Mirounga angustirostris]XP_045737448.1 transmembrane protein 128 isoform X1 [Mirounga angustirostris]XP_054364977.1 transmembrane protein 128 isoform X1 [Mirounga angustirostris]